MPSGSDDDLLASITELYRELRGRMAERWDRDLPFEELVFDRWERAEQLGFATGANIYQSSYVFGDVEVGERTWVGPLVVLDGTGGLVIGDHCCISPGAQIYTHDTIRRALEGGEGEAERSPVRIGDCTYIGANAVVLKGVEIGDHCVVGANSVIATDIPPYSVAMGAPARVRGEVVRGDDGEIRLRMVPLPGDEL
jgi:acetyltransferase-like isoleucine patch superfamily enzyme